MPRFFFHFATSDDIEEDDVGIDLPDLDIAYLETCETISDVAAEMLEAGIDPGQCAFHIADVTGRVLMEVPLLEEVKRRGMV